MTEAIPEWTERCTEALTKIIRDVGQEYVANGTPLNEIGNGLCENFAFDVLEQWVGESWGCEEGGGFRSLWTDQLFKAEGEFDLDMISKYWGGMPEDLEADIITILGWYEPSHMWITTDGKHFDAETPEGVEKFVELPFFQRWIEVIKEELVENPSQFDIVLGVSPAP